MTLIEFLVFLLLSLGLGFASHLISPRYGWWAGVAFVDANDISVALVYCTKAFVTAWN